MNKITGIALSISVALFLSACGSSGSDTDEENTGVASTEINADSSVATGSSTVDLNKQIVGKTFYLGDPHVESYAFATDGTIQDTWLVDGEAVSETGIYSIEGDILNITFASTEGTAKLFNAKVVDDSLRFYSNAGDETARLYTEKSEVLQQEVEGYATGSNLDFTTDLLTSQTVYFVFVTSETDERKYAEVQFFPRSSSDGKETGITVTQTYNANGSIVVKRGVTKTSDPYTILEDGSLEIDTFDNFKLLAKEANRWVVHNTHTDLVFREGNVTTERVVEWMLDKPEAIYNQENNISNDTNASE